VATDNIVK
ncbi:Late transcription factor VLTF-4 (1), partial [Monkeypox virus]